MQIKVHSTTFPKNILVFTPIKMGAFVRPTARGSCSILYGVSFIELAASDRCNEGLDTSDDRTRTKDDRYANDGVTENWPLKKVA